MTITTMPPQDPAVLGRLLWRETSIYHKIRQAMLVALRQTVLHSHCQGVIATCHEPEYLHFITTILTSILDLSDISLRIIFSYPFCTAYYGLMIFRTITRTVT